MMRIYTSVTVIALAISMMGMCSMLCGEGLSDIATSLPTTAATTGKLSATSAPRVDIGDKPDGCDAPMWGLVKEMLPKYPMELALPEEGIVVVRMADAPSGVFSSVGWRGGKSEDRAARNAERIASPIATTRLTMQHDNDGYIASIRIGQHAGTRNAMKAAICASTWMMSSARGSTWHGFEAIPVRSASFVANLANGSKNVLACAIGNMCVIVDVAEDSKERFPDMAVLGQLASKLSELMVEQVPDSKPAEPNQVKITVGDIVKDAVRISVETPKEGGCQGWWVRMDTTAGKWLVEAPSKARLVGTDTKGATVTCYAISPDGKRWYSTSAEIPRQPASPATTKPAE